MKKTLIVLISIFICNSGFSQNLDEIHLGKVKTLDTIISSLYDVVSGNKTKERDWELLKYLCKEDAKFITIRSNTEVNDEALYMTVEDYIRNASAYFSQNDFFEREIHRKVDTFGNISHVFSTYESVSDPSIDSVPFARGINSIQLFNDGKRWWIINIYWSSESKSHPIPKEYLTTDN